MAAQPGQAQPIAFQTTGQTIGQTAGQTGTPASSPVTLTIVAAMSNGWTRDFNPFDESGRLPSARDFIYEPLVIFNSMAGGRPEFRLATDYAFSNDLKTLTFKLRPGVQWSDGQPFTAADVVFTFDMLRRWHQLDTQTLWDRLAGVRAVDPYTVAFDLRAVDTSIVYDLVRVPVVPAHVWRHVTDPATWPDQQPVGSGPMTEITRFTPQVYQQCRNPHYWDAAALKVDCLRFPQVRDNQELLRAAAAGELDWFGAFLPDIDRTYVATDPRHHRYWFPPGGTVALDINQDTPHRANRQAFRNPNFRRAVSMAIDRRAIVDIAGYGYPEANEYASGIGRTYQDWVNPQAERLYGRYAHFDRAGALALLAESGFRDVNGDGHIDNPDGSPISFDILVPAGWTDWVNAIQLVAESLNALGLDVRISPVPPAEWTRRLIAGDYDMAINALFPGETPYFSFDSGFHSRHAGKTRFAATRFTNPELDAALDAFISTIDPARQRQAMDKVQMIIAANTPYIPLYSNPTWYEYNTTRFTGWFNADNPVARPDVFDGTPERLLHLLALRPVGDGEGG